MARIRNRNELRLGSVSLSGLAIGVVLAISSSAAPARVVQACSNDPLRYCPNQHVERDAIAQAAAKAYRRP